MTNDSPFFDDREHIFENSVGFVILDRYPVSEGHCLIVSKRVYSNYFDSSEEEIIGLNELLFQTKTFLDKKFKPSGYNVGINCGEVSGQTVDHLHIHKLLQQIVLKMYLLIQLRKLLVLVEEYYRMK